MADNMMIGLTVARLKQTLRLNLRDGTKWGKLDQAAKKQGTSGTGKLLDGLFRWRLSGNPQNAVMKGALNALHAIGLADPFETTPEISRWVKERLASDPSLKTDLDKAIFLFRSIIPSAKEATILGEKTIGLDDGLAIKYNNDYTAEQRKGPGLQLPKDIYSTPSGSRIAQCAEFSNLLVVILRCAGYPAFTSMTFDHVYTIAFIGEKKYKLDADRGEFELTNDTFCRETVNLAVFYAGKAGSYLIQGKTEPAREAIDLALEIDPRCVEAKMNQAFYFYHTGNPEEAIKAYYEALEIRAMHKAHFLIAAIHHEQNRPAEALASIDKGLEINPDHDRSKILKAHCLIALEQYSAAVKILEGFKPSSYLFATSRQLLGQIRVKQNDINGAKLYFEQARTCGYEAEENELNWNDLYLPERS